MLFLCEMSVQRAQLPDGLGIQAPSLPALGPYVCQLDLDFVAYKIGIIILTPEGSCDN